MKYSTKLKNQKVENLPAALIFVKMIYKLSAHAHTADNSYKPASLLVNLVVFNKVPGLAVDNAAMVLSIYRLFTFFVKFGEASCKFYTLTERSLYYDSAALNYMCLSTFSTATLLTDQFLKYSSDNLRGLKKILLSYKVDALFLLDYNAKYKVIKKITSGPYFVFGLCSSREKAFLYDIYLPIVGNSIDIQYLFIELALYGICLGNVNYNKSLYTTYSKMFKKIKYL